MFIKCNCHVIMLFSLKILYIIQFKTEVLSLIRIPFCKYNWPLLSQYRQTVINITFCFLFVSNLKLLIKNGERPSIHENRLDFGH